MKRAGPPLLAVVAVAALIGLLVYGVAQKSDTNRTLDDRVANGQTPLAPDRRMPVLGASGTRTLASYRGKVVVLNFWASWCKECKLEVPLLDAAHRKLATRGTVLGVTYLDATPDSERFVRDHHLTYPSLRDVGAKLGKEYGTTALPETFVLDRSGRIVAISRGVVSRRFLDEAIAKALKT